ncbi:hypothetical protein EYC80_004309 [Monilinia laxa]|uniref:Uncharacterized protein n=1 Tax=Monilinia laxa TaxID=61186 RepID=A0A5N6KMV5_MONLA|nr:hypothetical protein EYC80_004309 [Monilinia laxa]
MEKDWSHMFKIGELSVPSDIATNFNKDVGVPAADGPEMLGRSARDRVRERQSESGDFHLNSHRVDKRRGRTEAYPMCGGHHQGLARVQTQQDVAPKISGQACL